MHNISPAPVEVKDRHRPYKLASEVEPQEIAWLWKPYIARRYLTLLDADSGTGKSYITYAIAAALSTGRPFPGNVGRPRNPRFALICNCEDPADVMTVPRLMALGADLAHIAIFDSKALERLDDKGKAHLREAIGDLRPHLFTIDTIVPYLPAGVGTQQATDVRPTLRWLADLAAEFNSSGIVLRHLRKAAADNPLHAGQGSMDFVGTCRSLLIAAKDPTEPDSYVIAHAKNNIGPKGQSLRYGFDAQGTLQWRGFSPLNAEDLTAQRKPAKVSKFDEAVSWLAARLEEGERPQLELQAEARDAGIAKMTLRRAKEELGVEAFQASRVWWWHIPEGPPVAQMIKLDPNSHLSI